MNEYNSINEVFGAILNDTKFETITNEFCVWKTGEKFTIAEFSQAADKWTLYYQKEVVRALRILSKNDLVYSEHYKMSAGETFLKIDVDRCSQVPPIKDIVSDNLKAIQRLLYCKTKYEEIGDGIMVPELKVWVYPKEEINGLYLHVDYRMTKLLNEVKKFANLNSINIAHGHDEEQFLMNSSVREKLGWEDYLFEYHTGICFITSEFDQNLAHNTFKSRAGETKYGYIKKTPEIYWHKGRDLKSEVLYKDSQDYLRFGYGFNGFEEWKTAVLNYLSEKREMANYFYLNNKDIIDEINKKAMSSEWESIDDNPYYRWDIEDDEQDIEFWNSI